MQKYEPILYFMSPTKINYKCILNQYASIKIIKPLEENTGEDHSHFALIRDFFNMTLKAWATKNIYVRTNQTYSKLNISPPQNSFLRKSKTQARRKYLQTYIYSPGYIMNFCNSLVRQSTWFFKWAKKLNIYLVKEGILYQISIWKDTKHN